MPLAKPLPDIRRELENILNEDLATALNALKELLPEGSEKYNEVLALRARLNDANKEHAIRQTISSEEYMLRVNGIRAGFIDMLSALEDADFEPPAASVPTAAPETPTAKLGSVLYRVPRQMPLKKPSICTIRVAIDENAIVEDITLDDQVRFRHQVEVSEMMSADLLDPAGEIFTITPLNQTEQLVREQGYTQWLFSVTPHVKGEHQVLIKVAMLEYVENLDRYVPREITILETVTIVTEALAPADSDDTPLKPAGVQFALGHESTTGSVATTAAPVPPAAVSPTAAPSSGKPLRTAVLFAAFAVLGIGVTWALTPPPMRDWLLALLQNNPEAYAGYIEKHQDSGAPQLEKAYFKLADKTGALPHLYKYLDRYPQGQHREPVIGKVKSLETLAIEGIRQQPDAEKIRKFVQDFPGSQRLAEINTLVQDKPGVQGEVKSLVDAALANQASGQQPILTAPSQSPAATGQQSATPIEQPQTGNPPPVVVDRRSGLNMAFVQGAAFSMGDNSDKDNCAHSVTVKNFEIGMYEVTQADWREVMGSFPTALGFPGCDDCPVERVSWDDAQEFIKKANAKYATRYRLPSEAEWEYAARGGKKSKPYKYAGSNTLDEVAWCRNNSDSRTHPVGEKKANELGLYDMNGNVYEWCQDKYGPYPNCPEPEKATSKRVSRGGNWETFDPFFPVVSRFSNNPNTRSSGVGFRLAR